MDGFEGTATALAARVTANEAAHEATIRSLHTPGGVHTHEVAPESEVLPGLHAAE